MPSEKSKISKYIKIVLERDSAGDYEGLIKACRQVLDMKSDIPEIYYFLGCAYTNLGFDEKAIPAYEDAIRLNPDYTQAHINLGVAYYNMKKYKISAASFERAIEVDPEHPKAHYNLGNAYFEQELYDKALNVYKIAIKLQPEYAKAYYGASLCWLNLGDSDSAMGELVLLSNIDEEMANQLLKQIFPDQDVTVTGPGKGRYLRGIPNNK